jgi:hypothetical protein
MDEKLLTILGLHSLDKETLTFLKYALDEINGNEGANILNISLGTFHARAWRIRNSTDTLKPYEKKQVQKHDTKSKDTNRLSKLTEPKIFQRVK